MRLRVINRVQDLVGSPRCVHVLVQTSEDLVLREKGEYWVRTCREGGQADAYADLGAIVRACLTELLDGSAQGSVTVDRGMEFHVRDPSREVERCS